jgi:hypothetical protein
MAWDDVYELELAWQSIRSQAQYRGSYTAEDLTRLEDIANALARVCEEEHRVRLEFPGIR